MSGLLDQWLRAPALLLSLLLQTRTLFHHVTQTRADWLYASVEVCFNMSTPCFSNICIFDHLTCSAVIFFSDPVFLFIGLPVPVPQAIADPEPADLDRVQCGFVPVILSAAL